ncbi:MAG: helix-turn-helix transcriptional regulator [Candidatus Bathyarchaeia archaeon]
MVLEDPCRLLGDTKVRILQEIMGTSKSSYQLAEMLGIYESAVRRHLDELERNGIIQSHFKRAIGRPKKLYSIAMAGRELFSKRYDLLLTALLQRLSSQHGSNFVDSLLASVAGDMAQKMSPNINGESHEERIQQAVNLMNSLGYNASLTNDGDKTKIQTRDCIYCKASHNSPDTVCKFDTTFVSKLVGGVDIHLQECIARGSTVCNMVVERIKTEQLNGHSK